MENNTTTEQEKYSIALPENTKIYDWPTGMLWFDKEGILCSISKKIPPQTLEETKKNMEELYKILEGRKVCMLIDVTHTSESTKEVRDYAAEEFPKFTKAIAMVSNSALGKMLANLFFTVTKQPYPTKMFNNETEARKWLHQYL